METEMLCALTTREVMFRNRSQSVVKSAGTVVEISVAAFEAPTRYVYARIPGSHLVAALPRELIEPA